MFSLKSKTHLVFRFSVSLLTAHFFVMNGIEGPISAAACFIFALILVEFIHAVTKRLNKRLKNALLTRQRITEQFVSGFLTPSVLAFIFALLLGDITILYAQILVFIFVVNLGYLLYYHQRSTKMGYYEVNADKSKHMVADLSLPAIIYIEKRICFTVDFKGIKTRCPIPFRQLRENLDNSVYFQINRQSIIHRAAIRSIKPFNVKYIKIEPTVFCQIELITSRRMTPLFKTWVSKY